ncbi:MAG: hypothetical protein Q8P48_00760, partial [Deltaproteobacteria bacterium]|nr:hypothetical protein [Deltaproteobacteria bacterium]
MLFWILLLIFLVLNAVGSFAYSVTNTADPATAWGLFSSVFLYTLGITQTGAVFAAIMRLTKSGWGKYYSRIGEILTLCFIPVAVIMFIAIYTGGMEHMFYWAQESYRHGHHHGPAFAWLDENLFLYRYVITMPLFYVITYAFFRTGRIEERATTPPTPGFTKLRNVLAAFVLITYVIENTNIAWDFGMMIIKHWESSIFPPYFWSGNLLASSAFLFIVSRIFIKGDAAKRVDKNYLDAMGKVFIGFALLWAYMFWSQFIVIWYGDVPERTAPLFRTMSGNYFWSFVVMMLTLFVIPFISLIFRKIKLSSTGLSWVAVSICIGVWFNRYLMVVPVFSDA